MESKALALGDRLKAKALDSKVIGNIMNQLILIAILTCGLNLAWADSSLKFATTEAEFVQALQVKSSSSSSSRRQAKGHINKPKGVKAVVKDNPKVGVLIKFDFNSAEIKSESYSLLREFAKALQGKVLLNAKIQINGHTDSSGSDAYNLELSKRRAKSVKDFLELTYGIQANRLIIVAHGESQPLYPNNTRHRDNRRVEFVRMDK